MNQHHSVVEYLSGPEELTRKELVWGIVREPAAPTCSHQAVVVRTVLALAPFVARHALGRVLVSPVDVVLDEQKTAHGRGLVRSNILTGFAEPARTFFE